MCFFQWWWPKSRKNCININVFFAKNRNKKTMNIVKIDSYNVMTIFHCCCCWIFWLNLLSWNLYSENILMFWYSCYLWIEFHRNSITKSHLSHIHLTFNISSRIFHSIFFGWWRNYLLTIWNCQRPWSISCKKSFLMT